MAGSLNPENLSLVPFSTFSSGKTMPAYRDRGCTHQRCQTPHLSYHLKLPLSGDWKWPLPTKSVVTVVPGHIKPQMSKNAHDSFAAPWTVACQAPLSMGFPRQEYWSGLPFPPPGGLAHLGIKPGSPALQVDSLPSEPPGKTSKKIKRNK